MWSYAFVWLLHLLSFISHLQCSFAKQHPGYSTDLGITLNSITQTKPRVQFIVYTSVVEYEDDVKQFSNEQLVGLAHQAWDEMKAQHDEWANSCSGGKRKYIESHRPKMMSAIALGNHIYFASSMSANAVNILLQHENAALTQALNACRLYFYKDAKPVDSDKIHRTKASCGEIMASALHLKVENMLPWDADKIPTRVVAFGTADESVQKPCSQPKFHDDQPTISCLNWVTWQEMTAIKPGTGEEKVTVPPKKIINPSLQDVWKIVDVASLEVQKEPDVQQQLDAGDELGTKPQLEGADE